MPTEVIDALADMSVAQAIFLALGLSGTGAAVLLLALSEERVWPEHWVPERVRRSAVFELAALRWFQARDRARLLIAAAHLDSSSPVSKNGGNR